MQLQARSNAPVRKHCRCVIREAHVGAARSLCHLHDPVVAHASRLALRGDTQAPQQSTAGVSSCTVHKPLDRQQ